MGTNFVEFRQNPRDRGFSPTWFSSCLRTIQMVGVFGPKRPCVLVPRDGTESWKFWIVSDSPGWVWRLPSGGPNCVFVMIWTILS